MERIFTGGNPDVAAQQWIAQKLFSYPRIDGMFIAGADGRLLGTLPAAPNLVGQHFHPEIWKAGADATTAAFVSPVYQRFTIPRPDCTDNVRDHATVDWPLVDGRNKCGCCCIGPGFPDVGLEMLSD